MNSERAKVWTWTAGRMMASGTVPAAWLGGYGSKYSNAHSGL